MPNTVEMKMTIPENLTENIIAAVQKEIRERLNIKTTHTIVQKAAQMAMQLTSIGEPSGLMMRATVNGKIYQNDGDSWKEVEDFGVGYAVKPPQIEESTKGHIQNYFNTTPYEYTAILDNRRVLLANFEGEPSGNGKTSLQNIIEADRVMQKLTDKYPIRRIDFPKENFGGGVNVRTLDARPEDFTEKEIEFLQKMDAFRTAYVKDADELTNEEKELVLKSEPEEIFGCSLLVTDNTRPTQGPAGSVLSEQQSCSCDGKTLFDYGCICGFFEKNAN